MYIPLLPGDLQVIGATTIDEYRQHIEKDAALERRFQPVKVNEPTIDETVSILEGMQSHASPLSRSAHERCHQQG